MAGLRCRVPAAAAATLLMVVWATGCSTAETVELEFGYADVEYLEIYSYPYSVDPEHVIYTAITQRHQIAVWVDLLTDRPVRPSEISADDVAGLDADGLRFHLRDGTTYEVTQIFTGDSILVWPDGTVRDADHGSPSGLTGPTVAAEEAPVAAIP